METNKNLWLLPTDKPSRLYLDANQELQTRIATIANRNVTNQNIYITDDSEIKEGILIRERC
jgi:hypothetical protein